MSPASLAERTPDDKPMAVGVRIDLSSASMADQLGEFLFELAVASTTCERVN